MAEVVRLRHITRRTDMKFYYYSGVIPVKAGVIELPADNFTLIRRAWVMGFRQTEDGQPIARNSYAEIVAAATVTDSSEEQDEQENSSGGGQPRSTDRVREGESEGSGDTPKRRSRGSVSSGTRKRREKPASSTGDNE